MRIRLLTSFADGQEGQVYAQGAIYEVPGEPPFGMPKALARIMLDSQQAVVIPDEPESEMLVGGEDAMLANPRAKKRR